MFNYQKTQLGLDALQQRTRDLNARQRRLLVLIGTEDFDLLGDQFKQRLAPPELIEQLLDMQLIAPAALDETPDLTLTATIENTHQAETTSAPQVFQTEIQTHLSSAPQPSHAESLAAPIQTQHLHLTPPRVNTETYAEAVTSTETVVEEKTAQHEAAQLEISALSFEDVKFLMMDTLQRHCGLMAKQLIQRILQSQDIRSLKLCQMQWITSLQETRLPPKELNRVLQQINYSLQKLNPT